QDGERGSAAFAQGSGVGGIFAAAGNGEDGSGDCGAQGDIVFGGTDAAHHTRAEHGRAVFDGDDLRVQSGVAGRGHVAENVPDVDDGGGNDNTGARVDHRRGRGGAAGDRDGAAVGGSGLGLRHASGGKRTGAEPRRAIRGAGD